MLKHSRPATLSRTQVESSESREMQLSHSRFVAMYPKTGFDPLDQEVEMQSRLPVFVAPSCLVPNSDSSLKDPNCLITDQRFAIGVNQLW